MNSLSMDHVVAFTIFPRDAGNTTVVCDFLFHPSEIAKPGFDPMDAVEFWDITNCQDWTIVEGVQRGMNSRRFTHGYYAPMESASLDIRKYIAERLGDIVDVPMTATGAATKDLPEQQR
jgi:Rieske 2Fe-2S family protein